MLTFDLDFFVGDRQPEALVRVHGEPFRITAVAFDAQYNSDTGVGRFS